MGCVVMGTYINIPEHGRAVLFAQMTFMFWMFVTWQPGYRLLAERCPLTAHRKPLSPNSFPQTPRIDIISNENRYSTCIIMLSR